MKKLRQNPSKLYWWKIQNSSQCDVFFWLVCYRNSRNILRNSLLSIKSLVRCEDFVTLSLMFSRDIQKVERSTQELKMRTKATPSLHLDLCSQMISKIDKRVKAKGVELPKINITDVQESFTFLGLPQANRNHEEATWKSATVLPT